MLTCPECESVNVIILYRNCLDPAKDKFHCTHCGHKFKRHKGVKNIDLITRKEAQTNGYVRYFTGRKCVYGHISERQTANGRCMACHKLNERDRYRKLVKHSY